MNGTNRISTLTTDVSDLSQSLLSSEKFLIVNSELSAIRAMSILMLNEVPTGETHETMDYLRGTTTCLAILATQASDKLEGSEQQHDFETLKGYIQELSILTDSDEQE